MDGSLDELGRWARMTVSGKSNALSTICSACNVADTKTADADSMTVFSQQWQALRRMGVEPNPRKWFMTDTKKGPVDDEGKKEAKSSWQGTWMKQQEKT